MRWFRLDVTFPDHPKVVAVGGDAGWLHVCAIAYCNRNMTDGHISTAMLARLSDRRNPRKLATDLVRVGLWNETSSGWEIHDFLAYNDSRSKVEGEREAARQRMRKRRGAQECSPEHDENNAGTSPTTQHNTTQHKKTPPPTQLQAEPDSRLGGGGLPTWRNTVALTAANMLADKERPGTIANRAGWTFKVAQRLIAEHADWIDHTPHGTAETAAEGLLAHIYASNAPKPTTDDEYAKAGAGYGRAVAQAQVEGDMVDRDSFLGEIDGRPEAWKAAATVAYDEALSAVLPIRRHDAPSEATSAVLRLVGRQS